MGGKESLTGLSGDAEAGCLKADAWAVALQTYCVRRHAVWCSRILLCWGSCMLPPSCLVRISRLLTIEVGYILSMEIRIGVLTIGGVPFRSASLTNTGCNKRQSPLVDISWTSPARNNAPSTNDTTGPIPINRKTPRRKAQADRNSLIKALDVWRIYSA